LVDEGDIEKALAGNFPGDPPGECRGEKMNRFLLACIAGTGLLTAQTPVDRAWSILNGALSDQSAERRAKAARALGLIANNQKARQMAEKALSDAKPEVRAAAADSLGQMSAKASVPKLVELIKTESDTAVVFAAAGALYALGDPRAYNFYYAVLMGERKSGESLLESQTKMLKDRKAMAQMGLQAGLGFVPFGSLGYTVFKTATKDDASPVRAAAAQRLVRDPDPDTVKALMSAASDDKWMVRASVLNAIAQRGDAKLLSAVQSRLDDENETVRFTAAATVIRLTK
jgi:HEAT repeat protein